MNKITPIVIPSYEPDERFIQLLKDLKEHGLEPMVVVNDGSPKDYDYFFETAENDYKAIVLKHDVNRGKGRALKTAFTYCLENFQEMVGCITVDSDGQHSISSIMRIREILIKSPTTLVIGTRNFDEVGIPAKSQLGNNLTRKVFRALYKKDIVDTQTGLRAVPTNFMRVLLSIPGERFEFETRMLIRAVEDEIGIVQIPIETIYDSKENHSTHFRPVVDSIRIYKIFGFVFGKFVLSSCSSSIVDIIFFQIMCMLLKKGTDGVQYVAIATIIARVISAAYNYSVNYYFVFKSKEYHVKSALKYLGLALIQMSCSAVLTAGLVFLTGTEIELLVKIPIDVVLFFASYQIQKRLIY